VKCCAFCPTEAKKLSGEHIWDDWLNRALPTKRFRVRQRFSQLDPFRQYDAVALKEKLSVVCETCNNKWMSDVSNRAKKVLHEMVVAGKRTILFQADLRVVAAFGFMKCVVGDHATRGEDPFFSRAARERFRTSLTIPSEVQMWIAAFQGAYRYSGKFTTSLLAPSEPGPLEGIEFYSHTYVIGHLVLQTLAPGWKRVHDRVRPLPTLEPGTDWLPAAIQFLPENGSALEWPPPKYLGDSTIQRFMDRFNRINVSVG